MTRRGGWAAVAAQLPARTRRKRVEQPAGVPHVYSMGPTATLVSQIACAHDLEIAYTLRHPGRVAECPACPAIFQDGRRR